MANIKGLARDAKGFWYWRPSAKGLPKGTPRPAQVYLGTKDESEALSKLVELRGLELGPAGDGEERRLKAWVALYLAERKRVGRHSPRTSKQMEQSLEKMVAWFGDVAPRTIDRAAVMGFYASMQAGRSHGTVHQYLRYLRALFFWLEERGVVAANPAARLKLPVVRQSKRDRFCSKEERDKLLAVCDRDDLRFVLMAGFYLGMRINEIVNCRWSWFAGESCQVQSDAKGAGSFETKTRKSRMVPLHPVFRAYLAGLKRTAGDGEAFMLHPDKVQGKQWLRWDPRKGFKALTAACGLAWVTPHTMRHTFGSLHAMAGTPELKIRRWMGITQATLDRHYAGLSPDDEDAASI